ncbi:MAG TPA: N-acetylmuramic acid 6-phosphate etherase [Terriglobia bacterium]|nr:N-acetylmuramic acid 6-phosphate etherase [Terriglobia bacterium]
MRRQNVPLTEQHNPASNSLDTKTLPQLLRIISREDRKVPLAVAKAIPEIAAAIDLIVPALAAGGRLVYLGAGTSGRLGVLDAAECIPTFGTDQVIGILAGAPKAMFRPVEGAEDDPELAVGDLRRIKLGPQDVLVGISASGRTPYTLGGLKYAQRGGAVTVAVTANPDAPMNRCAKIAIVLVVGPEVVAGSTRMKAGTAQKLVLNMLSTASMIRLGRVFANWMINVQPTNSKLRRRTQGILIEATGASASRAARALDASGGHLPTAILMLWKNVGRTEAEQLLRDGPNIASVLRQARMSG